MPNHLHQASKIDALGKAHLLTPNPKLDAALSNSKSNSLPDITITPLQGQYLAIQCKLQRAKTVLEIGTLGGYSTIWFASTGAHVTSIEINPKHRDVAVENTKGLDVEIVLGAALDVLPKLHAEGKKFDFVFIDAAWEEQFSYFEWATKLARVGGAIYVDNVVRELLEEEELGAEGSLVSKVGKMRGVQASLITTCSSHKGVEEEMMDGFMLAIVEGEN
ncbi:S-adenosyl-L-methionine-dependent methyltransferase [Mollisia scopiformis]|uniref:S-adenosyl-L-methionine-dependent methyltransferase n=1 Tax=Mollisia scopiformis TaxID=149040 RepID=A0A194XHG2_MOLSC|nr:S-adenosyl-L-methionine-dependent methyltransferase [Mollisia scopiformis]KUJ19576.1 S-adenosyl-L-methionine-dependent methyltransferase [Mollisia scopiformis]